MRSARWTVLPAVVVAMSLACTALAAQANLRHARAVLDLTITKAREFTPQALIAACDKTLKDAGTLAPAQVARVYVLRADAKVRSGQIVDARRDFEAALEADPGNVNAQVGMAICIHRSGDTAEARRRLDELELQHPDNLEVLSRRAGLELALKNTDRAEQAATAVIAIDPQCDVARRLRATMRMNRKDYVGTIEDIDAYFATATCESPHELVALLILRGMAHLQLKEFGDAERSLQSALRHDPDNAAIFQNLWFAASQQDKYELAANWVEELQRVAPEQLGTVKMRAVTYMTLKRPEQAEPALQQWLKKAPRDAEALRYLCQLRHQSGQHAECLAALKRGLAAHPNDAVLLGMMTNVLATSPNTSIRNPQQANEYLERYREVETRRERVHYLQAIVLAANSDFDRAVAVLKESLAKDVLSLKERSQRESALSKLERNEKLLDDGSDSALNL